MDRETPTPLLPCRAPSCPSRPVHRAPPSSVLVLHHRSRFSVHHSSLCLSASPCPLLLLLLPPLLPCDRTQQRTVLHWSALHDSESPCPLPSLLHLCHPLFAPLAPLDRTLSPHEGSRATPCRIHLTLLPLPLAASNPHSFPPCLLSLPSLCPLLLLLFPFLLFRCRSTSARLSSPSPAVPSTPLPAPLDPSSSSKKEGRKREERRQPQRSEDAGCLHHPLAPAETTRRRKRSQLDVQSATQPPSPPPQQRGHSTTENKGTEKKG